jgi:YqaJ-like viral recombinase domain
MSSQNEEDEIALTSDQSQQITLQMYINQHAVNVQRNGDIWQKTIGGSEIGAVLGVNPYKTYQAVLKSKVKTNYETPIKFISIPCAWGNMFEPIIDIYVQADLGAHTYGRNVCFLRLPYFRYTPDALTVLHVKNDKQIRRVNDPEPLTNTTSTKFLLEYKCPYSSHWDGAIPEHYKMQILLGLSIITVVDRGLYASAIFRKCKHSDLGQNAIYDTIYHQNDNDKITLEPLYTSSPLAWGMIYIYAPRIENYQNPLFDYGDQDNDIFNDILIKIERGELIAKLRRFEHAVIGKMKLPHTHIESTMMLIGYIPFKLMHLIYRCVEYDVNFLRRVEHTAEIFFRTVDSRKKN